MSCDQHFTGNEENAVIYKSGGKRRVGGSGYSWVCSQCPLLPPQTLAKPSKYSTLMTEKRSNRTQAAKWMRRCLPPVLLVELVREKGNRVVFVLCREKVVDLRIALVQLLF